jgi:hypothetical protein
MKKKNVEPTEFDGQSTVAVGKDADLERETTSLGVSCKFNFRLAVIGISPSHSHLLLLKKMWTRPIDQVEIFMTNAGRIAQGKTLNGRGIPCQFTFTFDSAAWEG